MSYVRGENRMQASLLPAAVEEYVAADAPVRVIDAFVDGLDVKGLGFGRSVPATMDRPSYDPRDLLKLYLHGYLNEVRSSRRLEMPAGSRRPEHQEDCPRTDSRADSGARLTQPALRHSPKTKPRRKSTGFVSGLRLRKTGAFDFSHGLPQAALFVCRVGARRR
ncbi:transposase [Rhodopseudomonas sp. WA056]|uniref:transposase n=1 Tax=Rhodopseudomonas sp. WA056 TaxID=2269367 RepID=UPI0013DF9F2B|nr:transposase [Rhodopseudomonas sp. WA056]